MASGAAVVAALAGAFAISAGRLLAAVSSPIAAKRTEDGRSRRVWIVDLPAAEWTKGARRLTGRRRSGRCAPEPPYPESP